ncbi:MAG: HAMP domain-containing protein [Holophagales bacterium]|nr:HAMP domain-containing protein [Holophagales bacterium]
MSWKARALVYLAFLHVALAGLAVPLLRARPAYLLAAEAAFLLSLAAGTVLVRRLAVPMETLRDGADLLRAGELGTRLRKSGAPEVDALVELFNAMLSRLHEERVRQEEQQAFLARVLEASPLGVVTLGLDGRVDSASRAAAALLGTPAEGLRGKPLASAPVPLAQALAELPPGVTRVVAHAGARRVRIQRSHFLDRGFPRTFFLLVELTEELRLSEKAAYEKLIRMMSHEVNNSGAAVGSLLTSLLTLAPRVPEADREDFTVALSVSKERTERLNAFMKSLAEVVKVPEPRLAPADPNGLARSVVLLLGPLAERHGVAVALDADGALRPLPLDAALFEQALFNIVKNGIEAAGRGGRVTVRTAAEGRGAIEVLDTGPGIPPEVETQLFTPFFTTKPEGQGVGLTFVREVLASHGFRFFLVGPAGGPTRFRIDF